MEHPIQMISLRLITLVCLLLLPTQGWGAIAVDAASNGSTATISHATSGNNRALYVCTQVSTGGGVIPLTGVTYNGAAMAHKAGPITIASGQLSIDLWELVAPAVGTHDIVLAPTTNTAEHVAAVSYTGINQSTPSDSAASNSDDTGASNGPITVDVASSSGDVVIDCASIYFAAAVPTIGAGQTSRSERDDTASTGAWVGISEEAGAGTVTMSWTLNATPKSWATIGVSLNPATAAASNRNLLLMGIGQ